MDLETKVKAWIDRLLAKVGYEPAEQLRRERQISSMLGDRLISRGRELEYANQRARTFEASAVKNLPLSVPFHRDFSPTVRHNIPEPSVESYRLQVPAFALEFYLHPYETKYPNERKVISELYAKKFGREYGEAVTKKVLELLDVEQRRQDLSKS